MDIRGEQAASRTQLLGSTPGLVDLTGEAEAQVIRRTHQKTQQGCGQGWALEPKPLIAEAGGHFNREPWAVSGMEKMPPSCSCPAQEVRFRSLCWMVPSVLISTKMTFPSASSLALRPWPDPVGMVALV